MVCFASELISLINKPHTGTLIWFQVAVHEKAATSSGNEGRGILPYHAIGKGHQGVEPRRKPKAHLNRTCSMMPTMSFRQSSPQRQAQHCVSVAKECGTFQIHSWGERRLGEKKRSKSIMTCLEISKYTSNIFKHKRPEHTWTTKKGYLMNYLMALLEESANVWQDLGTSARAPSWQPLHQVEGVSAIFLFQDSNKGNQGPADLDTQNCRSFWMWFDVFWKPTSWNQHPSFDAKS